MLGPILLLGKTGQVGAELVRALGPLGPVQALDRAALDLADPDALRRAVRAAQPSLIVNAAAYTAVDQAESEPELAMAVNGTAAGVLAEEAAGRGIALMHYSTDYVFDGAATRPYREDAPTGPINVYGRSKLAGEQAVQAAGAAHLILRSCWIYAKTGRNFLTTIERLAAEREELTVVDDQIGSPTWARAIADATASILRQLGQPGDPGPMAERGGLYHIAAGGQTSWAGFAAAIVEHGRARARAGRPAPKVKRVKPIPTADYPTPAARPAYSVLDCTRLRARFGIGLPDWQTQLELCLQS